MSFVLFVLNRQHHTIKIYFKHKVNTIVFKREIFKYYMSTDFKQVTKDTKNKEEEK